MLDSSYVLKGVNLKSLYAHSYTNKFCSVDYVSAKSFAYWEPC